MRPREDVAREVQDERAFLGSAGHDSSMQRLATTVLMEAVKRRATHVRVRTGDVDAVEERHGQHWRDVTPSPTAPSKTWRRVVWSLKKMAAIDPSRPALCGAKGALATARADGSLAALDFDVTYARTPTGAAIVLASVPVSGDAATALHPATRALWDRATQWLDATKRPAAAGDADELRRCLGAAAEVAKAMGATNASHAASLWLRAGSIAIRAGLEADAVILVGHAIGAGISSWRGRVIAEMHMGDALEALERFDEARVHQERALAAAEALGAETGLLIHALSDAARGCARAGDAARAERLLDRAEAIAESMLGRDHAFLAPRVERARLRWAHDPRLAVAWLGEALSLADAYGDDETSVRLLQELAEADLARGAFAEAGDRLRRALVLTGSHPRAVAIHSLLARASSGAGRQSEALAVLRAGAEIARGSRPPHHPERLAIERELALAESSAPYR